MPDVREILAALSIDDRALWSEQRTIMRRSYLNAHNQTLGIEDWSAEDDAFIDLIDIRLALLFDRAGRLETTKSIIDTDRQEAIESDLKVAEDKMKMLRQHQINNQMQGLASTNLNDKVVNTYASDASKLLKNEGWK